jgi:mannose-6-phosphate isomerase-like protein (cupin superfamily)
VAELFISGPGEGTLIGGRGPLIKAFGEHADGAFAVVEGGLPPHGEGPVRHVHRSHAEAFFIVEGTMTLVLPDKELDASAGSYVLVPPGMPHTFVNRRPEPLRFVGISSPAGIERFLLEMAEATSDGPPDVERLHEIAERYDSYPA